MTDDEFKNDLVVQALSKITKHLEMKISQVEVLLWGLTKEQYAEFLRIICFSQTPPSMYTLSEKLNEYTAKNHNIPIKKIDVSDYNGSTLQKRTQQLLEALYNDGIARENIKKILSENNKD